MGREVKSIELYLENCELFTVERKHIGELHIGKIERIISRTAINSISEDYVSNEFHIEIHKDANVNSTFFKRITSYNDITQITINYEDNTYETLFLHWTGESDQENSSQSSIVSEVNGSLFIVVDEDKSLYDVFEDEISDDTNISWEMYMD